MTVKQVKKVDKKIGADILFNLFNHSAYLTLSTKAVRPPIRSYMLLTILSKQERDTLREYLERLRDRAYAVASWSFPR